MENLIVFAILMALGYGVGSYREKKHYEDIRRREKQTLHVPMMNFGAKQPLPQAQDSALFVGSVVITSDYFKNFSASLRNLVGGRVTVYETLIDRGRREATLRMKEQAIAWGPPKSSMCGSKILRLAAKTEARARWRSKSSPTAPLCANPIPWTTFPQSLTTTLTSRRFIP